MVEPGVEYVSCLWAAWKCGNIAVPLAVKNPVNELKYVLENSAPNAIYASEKYTEKLDEANNELTIKMFHNGNLATNLDGNDYRNG